MKKILIAITALLALMTIANATYIYPQECETCVDGQDGKDGIDGINGLDGADGKDGKDGADGKDGTVDYTTVEELINIKSDTFTQELINTQKALKKAGETANQAVAGATALSSIDFGSVCEGETAIGAGLGVSDSYIGTDYAGAVGLKHGLSDNTAGVVKGWKSKNTHAIGVGVMHKF